MTKHELKNARLRILVEIDDLNKRSEAGEDVSKELLRCGRKLDKLTKTRRRPDIMNADFKPAVAIPIKTNHKHKKTGERGQYKRHDISEEIKALAKKNDIKYKTLKQRIFQYGWDEYRAATDPVPKPNDQLSIDEYKRLTKEGWSGYRIIKEGRGTEYAIRSIKKSIAKEREILGVGK
ncbi:hypothetical protein ACRC6Q_16625 [Planococcus sp. SE5232]|uniref:hypothetical protein n=1 Tax=unclassified Planococcus (in: firmicutes) TaxID=2662419 RepID=UPI003D6AB243